MQLVKEINIGVQGITRPYLISIEYHCRLIEGRQVPIVTGTHEISAFGHNSDGSWFWDICPMDLSKQLDREMIGEWNAAHGLVVRWAS